jgi:hypothetical protein
MSNATPMKKRLSKQSIRQAKEGWVEAGEPMRDIALSHNVDHSTITRLKSRHAEIL